MTTRLAIISFEHVHAPQYLECLKRLPDVEIVAVVEPDPRRLASCAELLAGVAVLTDYQGLLSDNILDGVVLCSANARHKPMAVDFARAGIPILCEKPIATTSADAREMLAICQAHDVSLGICFPARLSEAVRQAKRLIQRGDLGKVLAVKATNHGTMPGDWFVDPQLSGGGAIMDHTVHVVDALRWIFDAEVTRVFAHAATRLHSIPVEDVGLLTLEMSNEAFVTLDTSWSRPNRSFPVWGDVTMDLIGSHGVLSLDLFPWTLNHFSEAAGRHLVEARDGDLNFRLLENFVLSLQGKAKVAAGGVDGLRALEVVEAAYKSIASHQAVAL
jgi:predicted dehydrogenase